MTYDNFKSHKKQDLNLSLEDTFLEKPHGVCVKLTPDLLRVNPVKRSHDM